MITVDDQLKLLLEGENVACDDTTMTTSRPDCCDLPPWYDEDKFKRGQAYYHSNIFGMFTSKLCGLLTVLAIPSIRDILIFTKMSSTRTTAYKRYVETVLHMHSWYSSDFKPGSRAWTSLSQVRSKHCKVSNRSTKAGIGAVTQRDMALTQFGFLGYAITRPEYLGIMDPNEENLEGFIHFWRVIGWILGVEDRFNICRESVAETKQLCNELVNKSFATALRSSDQRFIDMYTALLQGMWFVNPMIYVRTFMAFLFRISKPLKTNADELTVLETPKFDLSRWETIIIAMMCYVHGTLLSYSFFRAYFNFQMYLAIFLIQHFPFLAYIYLGINNSRLEFSNKVK